MAIVAGVRTPFARSGTVLKDYTAIDLGKLAVAELVQRTALDGALARAARFALRLWQRIGAGRRLRRRPVELQG